MFNLRNAAATVAGKAHDLGLALALAAMLVQPALACGAHQPPKLSPELERVRDVLAKYKNPVTAVRDGYFSTLGCVHYKEGAMGVHFLNPALTRPRSTRTSRRSSSTNRRATNSNWWRPNGSFRWRPASTRGRRSSGSLSMARWQGTNR